jgi:hypothetical protein
LNLDKLSPNGFEAIQKERFYIVRNVQEKVIYFILSN